MSEKNPVFTEGEERLERELKCAERRIGKRIHEFLERLWQQEMRDYCEQSPYEESVLSMEVRAYFGELASQEMSGMRSDTWSGEPMEGEETERGSLRRLYESFGLDAFERFCLELAVLGEINPFYEKFFIYCNNDWNSGHLTVDTAVSLFGPEGGNARFFRYFSEGSRLMEYFLKPERQEGKSRLRWGFRCRDAFLQLLFSGDGLPGDVSFFIRWQGTATPDAGCGSGADRESDFSEKESVYSKLDVIRGQRERAVYLCGADASESERLVGAYAKRSGHVLCLLDIQRLAYVLDKSLTDQSLRDICMDVRLWLKAKEGWLCLGGLEKEFLEKESNRQLTAYVLCQFQNRVEMLFVTGELKNGISKYAPGIWELQTGGGMEADALCIWEEAVAGCPLEEEIGLEAFAATYRFTAAQVRRILEHAERRRLLAGNTCIRRGDLKESCIRETCAEGSHFVTVMNTGYRWDDLVLPESQKRQLAAACGRVIHRGCVYGDWGYGEKMAYGRGVSMVFCGPPGTGKTMAAGIVADYLGTTLYRVDLAAVVSKYIGETEKNLNTVFESVRKGQGVLFFDEADVLFGRRTQVSNSNDKHSNMEAAYLLQKMEEYEGVVILATNYLQNIDEAFKRRLQFLVYFPFPGEEQREALWRKAFPEQIKFEEEPDFSFLAGRFELSGSQIKNIALQSAFFAAESGRGVGMEHIVRALLMELEKTGKRVTREDLQGYDVYYK